LHPDRQDADAGTGIAVFGAADAEPGEELWNRAAAVGREVAVLGLPTVTGGYGGVMEAACQAARQAGGETIGVTCRMFPGRVPNAYLTLEIEEDDLFARTARLFALSRGFVVLAGGAGTLAELTMLWAHARVRALPGPVVIWDETWAKLARRLTDDGRLAPASLAATRFASTALDAARLAAAPLNDDAG
jgi:hypothetical protein